MLFVNAGSAGPGFIYTQMYVQSIQVFDKDTDRHRGVPVIVAWNGQTVLFKTSSWLGLVLFADSFNPL